MGKNLMSEMMSSFSRCMEALANRLAALEKLSTAARPTHSADADLMTTDFLKKPLNPDTPAFRPEDELFAFFWHRPREWTMKKHKLKTQVSAFPSLATSACAALPAAASPPQSCEFQWVSLSSSCDHANGFCAGTCIAHDGGSDECIVGQRP